MKDTIEKQNASLSHYHNQTFLNTFLTLTTTVYSMLLPLGGSDIQVLISKWALITMWTD